MCSKPVHFLVLLVHIFVLFLTEYFHFSFIVLIQGVAFRLHRFQTRLGFCFSLSWNKVVVGVYVGQQFRLLIKYVETNHFNLVLWMTVRLFFYFMFFGLLYHGFAFCRFCCNRFNEFVMVVYETFLSIKLSFQKFGKEKGMLISIPNASSVSLVLVFTFLKNPRMS